MSIRKYISLVEALNNSGELEEALRLSEWIESYENGKIVLRTESGQLPDFLYRFMSPKEYALAVKRGAFYPMPGERIHASERPEKRYSEHDSVLVRFTFHEEDGWRPKWGGDTLYAVTDGPVPFDHGELLKD